jgi:hypothetical protein
VQTKKKQSHGAGDVEVKSGRSDACDVWCQKKFGRTNSLLTVKISVCLPKGFNF